MGVVGIQRRANHTEATRTVPDASGAFGEGSMRDRWDEDGEFDAQVERFAAGRPARRPRRSR